MLINDSDPIVFVCRLGILIAGLADAHPCALISRQARPRVAVAGEIRAATSAG